MDYIFRWLQQRFLTGQQQMLFDELRPKTNGALPGAVGPVSASASSDDIGLDTTGSENRPPARGVVHAADALKDIVDMGDAPSCSTCGAIMTRNGSCYRCMSCGSTSGCS